MYFISEQHPGIKRLQSSFIEPEEIIDMLDNMKFDYGYIEGEFNEVLSFSQLLTQFSNAESEPDSSESENEDERLSVQIILWTLGKENISNKQIKDHSWMGYDRAKIFLKALENFGIIPEQRKGTKLPRTVYQDKAKEFLEAHGYNDDGSKKALNHAPGVDEIEVDTEPMEEKISKLPLKQRMPKCQIMIW